MKKLIKELSLGPAWQACSAGCNQACRVTEFPETEMLMLGN
jgi:hypothetical protein